MSFFDEISYRTLLGRAVGYSAVLMGGEAVYVEGISRIVSVSGEKIEVSARKKLLVVEGEDLSLEEVEKESVIIKGRIACFKEC
ncbi:MAG: YabP/YqfC family sporulation protein [Clostridia bacterium]|nr:YabP/YqfC family sporulation protein [Clostridia bacterium]